MMAPLSLFHSVLFLLCISFSLGTIWKTDDAYIIDDAIDRGGLSTGLQLLRFDAIDDPAEDSESLTTTDSTNVCVDSAGAQGRCVPAQECSPFYDFFSSQNKPTQLEILEGLERHLNSTKEPCLLTSQDELPTTTEKAVRSKEVKYVCCTSLKYTNNVRVATSLDEYLLQTHNQHKESIPEIPLAISNSSSVANTYIVSGRPAIIGEFPYAVAIIYNGKQFCGGSLLDSQWVLSAAHCFDQFTSEKVRRLVISIGDHDLSTNQEVYHQIASVSKLFLHQEFFRAKGYFISDVALIKLRNPVYGYSNVRTVSLHTGAPNINHGHVEAEVVGWGRTCGDKSCAQSTTLLKTTLQVISNAECSQWYTGTSAPPISQGMVCAWGNDGRDSCYGDSGGPLVIHDHYGQTHQIGIVSFGIGCGSYPGIYTRVSNYVNWINKHKSRG